MKCKICGREISYLGMGSHLNNKHSISVEQYYLKYVGSKRRCEECGKPTKFNGLEKGYNKYCSILCANSDVTKKDRIKETNLKRYGTCYPIQNKRIHNKIKRTNLKRYGFITPSKNKKVQKKIENTNFEKYGCKCSLQNKEVNNKARKSCIRKYGTEYAMQNNLIYDKLVKTNKSKYGCGCSLQNKLVKKKSNKKILKIYGVTNVAKNKGVQSKIIKTNLEKYGVEQVLGSRIVRDKIKATNRKRYGHDYAASNPEIHKKIFASRKKDNHGYLSNSEYLFSKKLKDTFYFRSEYFLNEHHFDFAIFKHGKLDVLVEIDGEYFHGLLNDVDGNFVGGSLDHLRFSLVPKGIKFLVIDSKKIKEGFKELRRIYHMEYKEWIKDMIKSIPKSIPYYSFSDNRMKKDYSNLCTYKYHKNANLGISTIKNFSRSLFNDIDWSERSSLIKEHKLYYSPVSSHNPLEGLIEIENISRLREKYRKKYKGKKEVRIKKHTLEKMLAICSLGKRYVSKCADKECLEESKRIIKFHKLNATLEG